MLGTRKTVTARNLFDKLPFNPEIELFSSDSDTDSEPNSNTSNMTDTSSTSTISDLTNPFAGKINLKDKVGLSLFSKATEGLKAKFDFNIENARKTVEAIERANQAYFWGHVWFKFPASKDGADYNLICNYNNLAEEDVINHSKGIWGSGTSYEIPNASTGLTEENIQKRIQSSLISKWLINSMTDKAINDIMLDKSNFSLHAWTTVKLKTPV